MKNEGFEAICVPLSIYIVNIIISIIILFIVIFDYKDEDLFINAIEKTWKNYPIFNLSLTPLEGYEEITFMKFEEIDTFCDCTYVNKFNKIFKRNCKEYEFLSGCSEYSSNAQANKIYNSKIYAKYYEADYITLFNRIKKNTSGKICNEEFEKCGILDLNQNTFCIKRGELCPINSNIKFIYSDDGKISSIYYNRGDTTSYILNRLYASEVKDGTIFDINKFYISDDEKSKQKKYEEEKYYHLGKLYDYKNIYKNEFYLENSLIKGSIPQTFNSSNIYLYYLIYPANSDQVYLGEIALYLLKKPNRIILKGSFMVVKTIFVVIAILVLFLFESTSSFIIKIIITFYLIIITILLIGLTIINIIYIYQKYKLHKILYYTNIISGSGLTTFIIQIIFEIIPELLICLYFFVATMLSICDLTDKKEKTKKNQIDKNENEIEKFDKINDVEEFTKELNQDILNDD